MVILRHFVFFLLAAVCAALPVACVWLDAAVWQNGLSEFSLTEILQEMLLLFVVGIYAHLARRVAEMRQCYVLVAGFFLTLFIRELDGVLDSLAHGSWKWFALAVTAAACVYALRRPKRLAEQLERLMNTPQYGMLVAGLLCLLVFARVFGKGALWEDIVQQGYVRLVKNAVEEGTELFAYVLCALAGIDGFLNQRRAERSMRQESDSKP